MKTAYTRPRQVAAAIFAGMAVNGLMFWMLAVWNRPQSFEPPAEPAARLLFVADPAPQPQRQTEPEEPDQPPPNMPVMEVNLDMEPQPPAVEPLDLQLDVLLDLSVPSVEAVFVPVARRTQALRPAVARPLAAPAVSRGADRQPLDADAVDQPPRELTGLQPQYPLLAERLGREAAVQIRVVIDEQGRVADVEVLKVVGHESFVTAVLDVARRWRFEPARDGGRPVRVAAKKILLFQRED